MTAMVGEPLLQVAGLLLASELPTRATDVGDCIIFPLSEAMWTPPREGGPSLDVAPGGGAAVALEPEVRFAARHAITTTVPVGDEAAARSTAQTRFDRVVGLLALAQGPHLPPPLVQVVAVVPVPAGTKLGASLNIEAKATWRANFHGVIVNPMSDMAQSRFVALDGMARAEPGVANVLRLWVAAEHANRLRFSDADRDSCMVHYCKVMEQVAIIVRTGALDVSAKRAAIVAEVHAQLGDEHLSVDAGAMTIEEGARKLQDLRAAGVRSRLLKMLSVLPVEPEVAKGVLDVWDLRNSRAGHPSPASVTDDQVNSARIWTGELLMHYFNWRWAQSSAKTSSPPS
jgi:hypothetical protein